MLVSVNADEGSSFFCKYSRTQRTFHYNATLLFMFSPKLLIVPCLVSIFILNDAMAQKNAIRDLLLTQQDAWNAGDIETFMQGYVNSDSLRFVGSSGEIRGWQSTLERYQRAYPDRATMGALTFNLREIRLLGQKHAMIFGTYTLERENDQPTGHFTLIAEYTIDGWRIIHDHTSADAVPVADENSE